MSSSNGNNLLRDLLGLYLKYGDRGFQDAIKALESGSVLEMLLRVTVAGRGTFVRASTINRKRQASGTSRKTPKQRLEEFIRELSSRNDEESLLVSRFISDVAERRALQNAPMLRQFSQRLGISEISKMDRRIVALKIGERLLRVAPEERRAYIATVLQSGSEKSSLQEWSKIIVKDHR